MVFVQPGAKIDSSYYCERRSEAGFTTGHSEVVFW